jgi:DNA-binding response OmpR family regulator
VRPRILVVDDEELIRRLYLAELARDGYEVDTVASGAEAIDQVNTADYRAVVLDIELPDMAGLEVLQRLREVSPDTPIILNSAYTTYKTDFRSWLADDYIVKSSDLEPLKQKIKELVTLR